MFPGLIYVKLIGIAAVVAGASYMAWSVRGAYAGAEKEEAVAAVVKDMQAQIDREREVRQFYTDLADHKLADLMKSISDIRVTQSRISAGIEAERKRDPKFYNQPLPEGGLEEWQRAKALIAVPAASSSSASARGSPDAGTQLPPPSSPDPTQR